MEKKNNGYGGRRPGAGRPKGDSRSRMITFRCPETLAGRLDALENRTGFIRDSLEKALEAVRMDGFRTVRLPLYEQMVVAGFPVPLDNDERSQDVDLIRMLCPYPEASYLVRVCGNSMMDADIMDGDIVIVDKSNRDPSPKDVAVCCLNGEFTLKRFVRDPDGQGWLVPANPDYPRIPVTADDAFSIWGTVTYVIHKART